MTCGATGSRSSAGWPHGSTACSTSNRARASLADWRRGRVTWQQARRPAVVQELPNLWLYYIPALLPTRATGDLFDRATDRLLAIHLRRTLQRLGLLPSGINHSPFTIHHSPFSPILWLYRPTRWRWAAANFPHSLLVYHITDDYAAFGHLSDAQRAALLAEERDLLRAADLVIVTAPRLLELKASHARRIELVPNGVDLAAFQRALPPRPLPLTLSPSLPLSSATVATSALAWTCPCCAQSRWHGRNGSLSSLAANGTPAALRNWRRSKALPNVHFLGLLPVEEVPPFIVELRRVPDPLPRQRRDARHQLAQAV